MSIEKHLNKYYSDVNKEEVEELVLDSININEIKNEEKTLLNKFSAVNVFSMNCCGLKSLNNLPEFSSLECLDLNDNKLKGEELAKVLIYKNLAKLKVSNNQIRSLEDIKILSKLEHLTLLDLTDCPIAELDNYREEVFKVLPQLQILDLMYKDGKFYESENDMEDDEDDEDFEEDLEEGEDFDDEEDEEFEDDEEESDVKPSKKQKLDN